ncbi:MAG: MarR family transcriptional regulator [Thermoanaerobacterales bacterium]|nr:MarR family transcriptional regulator [Thermoanaerobacterales bacterium]
MDNDRRNLYLREAEELIARLFRQMHSRHMRYIPQGLTMSQFAMCKIMHHRGRATVSELAEELGVSLSAITAAADRLCEAGLAARERDAADRRVVWLSLTEHGQRVMDEALKRWQDALRGCFGRLPLEDLKAMLEICRKLLRLVEESPSGQSAKA